MATLRREIQLDASSDAVWASLRDFGAVHIRVAPGFVVDARMDGDARFVTFANGLVARERLVTLDDAARRLVYSAESERLTHHNASVQVVAEGTSRCRLEWVADLLPDEVATTIGTMMDDGVAVMKPALEQAVVER
jgi:Fe-S cluster assembly scaffold protein SufB